MNIDSLFSHIDQKPESGILYIVGTPIGNSMDLSPRGIEAFEQADFILCEDTRVTKKLSQLRNFRIQKLISFNEFNKYMDYVLNGGTLPYLEYAR